jgi:hypothetical protein
VPFLEKAIDLSREYAAFFAPYRIYEAETTPEIRPKLPTGGQFWNRVVQNRDDRYHYLEEIPKEFDLVAEGIPALVIDFKRCFTIPARELYRQCTLGHGARRRCRLEMPYREHLQSRAVLPSTRDTPAAA